MDFQSELAQYRQRFAQREAEVKAEKSVEPESPDAMWAEDIQMPMQGGVMPMDPEMFANDVNVPDVLTDNDPRFTGNQEQDAAAFQEYMMNDPMMQQFGPQMEAILEEIIKQAMDPENPMSAEEAQELFVQMMEEEFGEAFRG